MLSNKNGILTPSPLKLCVYICVGLLLFSCFDVACLGLHLLLNSFFFSNISQSQYCQIVVIHVNSLRLSFFISKWDHIEMFTPLQNIWIILKYHYQKKKNPHSYQLYVQLYIFPLVSKEQSWFTLSPVWLFQNLDEQQTGTLQLEHRIQLTSQKPICFPVCKYWLQALHHTAHLISSRGCTSWDLSWI